MFSIIANDLLHSSFRKLVQACFLASALVAGLNSISAQEESEFTQPAFTQSEFTQQDFDFFENKVRPLLVEHCLKCHGEKTDNVRGNLWLTSREQMLSGGDSGPAMVPGKPDESVLISAVNYDDFEMPPSGQLSDDEIATLTKWVEMGAPDPRNEAAIANHKPIDLEVGREFWSFQIVEEKRTPDVENPNWCKSEIDRYILAKLEEKQINPVADTDRTTLIRRVYLTLTGLPPSIEQIDRFVTDEAAIEVALAGVIDELLQSKHFGERWGRHWLDVARFAESSGGGRSLMFPEAWRFRDYVIEAYNDDKPLDQFIKEQIAGDLLPFENREQRIEQLIAAGFLVLGPNNYELQDKELLTMEVVDEQIDTVGRAFLGMTLGCARCHDHKFDPIPTSDYYALAGIFKSTQSIVDGNVSKYVEQSVATQAEISQKQKFEKQISDLSNRLASAKTKYVELGGQLAGAPSSPTTKSRSSDGIKGILVDNTDAKLVGEWKPSIYSSFFVDNNYQHDINQSKGEKQAVFVPTLKRGGVYEVQMSYSPGGNRASNVPVTIDHQDGKTEVFVNQSQTPSIDGLFVSLGKFRFEADNVSAVTISTEETDGHVIIDSIRFLPVDETSAAETIEPESLAETNHSDQSEVTAKDSELQKAENLVKSLDAELVLLKKSAVVSTSSAMSVREDEKPIDGHVHIRGNVRMLGDIVPRGYLSVCSPDGFDPNIPTDQSGRLQLAEWIADPDHPLTARVYVNRVWRHLFGRGLVETTDNFGAMGSKPTHPELLDFLAKSFVADGWSTKKLIRRIMLSRVYRLSTAPDSHAASIDQRNTLLWRAHRRRVDAEVLRDSILTISGSLDKKMGGRTIRKLAEYDLGYEFDSMRRSVYVPAFRNSMLDLFEVFDIANPNLVTGNRNTSTLPTQALYLMNSPFVIEQSQAAAIRLLAENFADDATAITVAYRRTLGRSPTESESRMSLEYLQSFGDDNKGNDKKTEAWSSLFHSLFASLDFRYLN